MSEVTEPYAPGRPCWFDMTVREPEPVHAFYRHLLGWEFEDSEWRYHRATIRGKAVAAISTGEPEDDSHWNIYLATRDTAATARAVEAAGGKVIKEPHDVPGGTMAIVADPTGGYFGLWQGDSFDGSELVNEAGAPCWAEASSKDTKAAGKFFATVFGLEAKRPFPKYSYVQLRADGTEVAGILGYSHEGRPKKGHAAWLVYFQVDDTDAAVRVATENGGTVVEKPEDSPFGRMAILADPAGARLAVITRPAK